MVEWAQRSSMLPTQGEGAVNPIKSFRPVAAIAVLVACHLAAFADVVYLKDGGKLEGKVSEQGDTVIVRIGSIKTTIEKDRVLRIEKKMPPREEYRRRLDRVPAKDAAALYELGMWCLDRKLASESRDCFARVLSVDPNHQEARRRLGHVVREGKWVKPCAKCGGTGKVDCHGCKGTGSMRVACTECTKGKHACEVCNGQGFLLCQNCGGAGGFACMACGGTGGYWEQEWLWVNGMYIQQPVWHQCPRCAGQGRIDCPACVRGRVDCKRCTKGRYKCPSCDGRGYRRVTCAVCKGARKLDCPACRGRGHTDEGTVRTPTVGHHKANPPIKQEE